MDGPTVTLRRAEDEALSYVETLLEANGLPSADVRTGPGRFDVAFDGDERVGVGGLEVHGNDGLLRSLVVERSARREGVGAAVYVALEREARAAGVETLYLLTTSAAGFYAERGYVETARADVPGAVRGTAEFEDLCPTTVTPMEKSLSGNR